MSINALANNIKKKLIERDMTVSMFERSAGLKKSAVANIISGKSKNPTIETISSIAEEFGCDIEELAAKKTARRQQNLYKFEKNSNIEINTSISLDLITTITHLLKQNNIKPNFKGFRECLKEVYFYLMHGDNRIKEDDFLLWIIKPYFSNKKGS